ncbi:prolyl oligopeptidase family serine peptidase [Thalassotalea psychrophila]|uniref:Prolyl oligopeptidase family serine peptidase n=1 Tax=Thalassotalea psychrophila TaxID=3065647 RepID=A0ABY9TT86_9GAMM|nr:prolyl oligopeptidase family serine peptidase [Colwelliaceae bacterium SQ149]
MSRLNSVVLRVTFTIVALLSYHTFAKPFKLIPVEDIMQSSQVYSMILSPDGKYIFSYEHMPNYNIVRLIDPQKKISVPMFRMDRNRSSRVEDYQWVDKDTVYLQMKKKKGFINIKSDGEQPEGIWQPLGVKGFMVSTLPNEENTVLFARDVTKKRKYPRFKLYKITTDQLAVSNYEQAIELENTLSDAFHYIYDDVNKALLAAVKNDDVLEYWYQLTPKHKWKKFFEIDAENQFIPIGFLSEDTLAVLTNKNLDRTSLVEFDIKTNTLGKVIYQHPNYDLIDAKLNKMNEGINFVTYLEQGIPNNHYFAKDKADLAENLRTTFKNQQVSVIQSSLDDNYKLINIFSSTNPGKFYFYQADTNKATFVTDKRASLTPYKLNPTKVFNVEVEPGVFVEALLTKPEGYTNGVLLVNPHGGPIGIRDLAIYDAHTQFFTNRGYSVLKVNFRGSSGYGKQFQDEGRGEFGKLIEHDISAAVKQVRSEHKFEQMCSIGSSYGGYSAMMLAIKHPEDYQCIVAMYGIYDLSHLYNANNRIYSDEHRQALDKVIGGYKESLKDVSPLYLAEDIKAPILLIAGKKDNIAYFEQSNRMKYRLQQLGKDIETVFYNSVGHGYHDNWNGDQHEIVYIEDFIRRQLNLPFPSAMNDMQIKAQERRRLLDAYDVDKKENTQKIKSVIAKAEEQKIEAELQALIQEQLAEEKKEQAEREAQQKADEEFSY